jgi:DNA-binding NarL/FixJ family response regulator
METVDIIIADSHYLSRKGLAMILDENPDFTLLAQAANMTELIALSNVHHPKVIIVDYTSTNFNIDHIETIATKFPHANLLAITELHGNRSIAKSLITGITSHLLKECEEDEVIEAIYKTAIGERFMCGKITSTVLDGNNGGASCEGSNISDREMEIIALIAEGYSNKEVADKLFLSTHTITTHRKNIMNKLGVNNTAGLVLFAVRENLVSPNHFLFSN